ncbi:AraC-type DNA-binding protein [Cetobacterium ceti]|uniref:AraC-type DNA-binding protein n=1 Tax=Cetobacterium ceti TaxID=180163 RepID=A0A1T4P8T5_9FUSO|nr:helix-turn-helix domain-containing protein [Cetobacterium ceti]SJZ87666.1 AraC-type DNA-binding protein [Cetobacterium ceti]
MKDNLFKNVKMYLFVLFFIIFTLFFIKIIYKEKEIFKKNDTIRIEKLFDNINLKEELLIISMEDLKNNFSTNKYFYRENPTSYEKLQALLNLQQKNSFYSNIGYTLSSGKYKSNYILTNEGSLDKKEYFYKHNFNENNLQNFLTISSDNNNFNFLITNKSYLKDNNFWIITIDRNKFFKELYDDINGKWYIGIDDSLYAINQNLKLNIDQLKNPIKFKTKILNLNLYYEPLDLLHLKNIFKEFFIISIILSIFFTGILYFIKFIEKPIMAFKNKIEDLNKIDKRKNLKDHILGVKKISSISDFTEKFQKIYSSNMKIILLEILNSDISMEELEKFSQSKNFLKTTFINENIEYIDIDYKSILFLVNNESSSDIEQTFFPIINKIYTNFNINVIGSVSKKIEIFNNLSRSYLECKRLLENKYLFKDKELIFSDNTEMKKIGIFYSIKTESKLASKILNNNFLGSKKIIEDIFLDLDLQTQTYKIKEFTGLLYNTLNRVIIQLKEMNINIDYNKLNIDNIARLKNLEEIKKELINIISIIYYERKNLENEDDNLMKNRIQEYIEKNYSTDFSLENLADHLGLSFKYTSILFKKVMNSNFKNYINFYRIKQAKFLLEKNPELKIKDLAQLLGYNSSNTFIKVFKKYEGISPAQWKG